jgi:PhnB protein
LRFASNLLYSLTRDEYFNNFLLKECPVKFNPYLLFSGNCEEAFTFYHKILGGEIQTMMKHEGSPAAKGVPPEWLDKILHATLVVGENVIMASDAPPGHYSKPQGFSVNIGLNNIAEAERIFRALSEGGAVGMPIQETFWAVRFGMCTDRFGIPWMVNCEKAA